MSNPDVELTKFQIDRIFEGATDQSRPFIALYRHVFPDWDNIKKVVGWPRVGEEAYLYIRNKFVELDRKYHPDVITGGLWFNSGFGCDDNMPDWIVNIDECEVTYA